MVESNDEEMLSLRSFHIVLVSLGIVLAAGTGTWAFFNRELVLGVLSFIAAVLFIWYGGYYMRRSENLHLRS